MVERGLWDAEQLELALAEHLCTGRKLGEVLLEHGWLTTEQLSEVLDEQARGNGARGIDLLRSSVAEAEAELEQPGPEDEARDTDGAGHLLFVWGPSGYALLSRSGDPPPVGTEVGISGGSRVVTKIGPSPLPGDPRPCAFLDGPST